MLRTRKLICTTSQILWLKVLKNSGPQWKKVHVEGQEMPVKISIVSQEVLGIGKWNRNWVGLGILSCMSGFVWSSGAHCAALWTKRREKGC